MNVYLLTATCAGTDNEGRDATLRWNVAAFTTEEAANDYAEQLLGWLASDDPADWARLRAADPNIPMIDTVVDYPEQSVFALAALREDFDGLTYWVDAFELRN